MDVQTLVILFLVFSAISSIINRLQQRQKPDESKLERKTRPTQDPFEEEEVDWDVFAEQPEPKPEPLPAPVVRETPKPAVDAEYREVVTTRPVVTAAPQAVPLTSPIAEEIGSMPSIGKMGIGRRGKPLAQKKHTRRSKLNFKAQTVRQAIIYNEILGPPRSEQEHR